MKNIIVPSTKEIRDALYGNIINNPLLEDIKRNYLRKIPLDAFENNPKGKLKLSPFTKIFRRGDVIALFHSYLLTKMYGGRELKECLNKIENGKECNPEILEELIKNYFVVGGDFSKEGFIEKFKSLMYGKEPVINLIYLIMTDECNFYCKYCFIRHTKGATNFGKMDFRTAKNAVDYFIKQIRMDGRKTVIFYGGEPLVNFEVMKKISDYIRRKEREKAFRGDVVLNIVTNGSLVTDEVAQFFKQYGFSVGVSIDGDEVINNKMRVYSSDRGTFRDVERGINTLKKYGIDFGLSVTVSKHNFERLEEITENLCKRFDVRGLGFNLFQGNVNSPFAPPIENVARNMINANKKLIDLGVIDDRIFSRRVLQFVEGGFWTKDCAGYGHQIIFLPNGMMGPCHGLMGHDEFFPCKLDECHKKNENIHEKKIWQEWNDRISLNIDGCVDCAAISFCGGGCAYCALENDGTIHLKDRRMCVFCNMILDWLVWELYDRLIKNKTHTSL